MATFYNKNIRVWEKTTFRVNLNFIIKNKGQKNVHIFGKP